MRSMRGVRRLVTALACSPFFWIFLILLLMVGFILWFERPATFQVDRIYHLF